VGTYRASVEVRKAHGDRLALEATWLRQHVRDFILSIHGVDILVLDEQATRGEALSESQATALADADMLAAYNNLDDALADLLRLSRAHTTGLLAAQHKGDQ